MIGKDMQFEANRKFLGMIIHIDSRYLPRKMSLQISCMPIHCLRNYIVVCMYNVHTSAKFLIHTTYLLEEIHITYSTVRCAHVTVRNDADLLLGI